MKRIFVIIMLALSFVSAQSCDNRESHDKVCTVKNCTDHDIRTGMYVVRDGRKFEIRIDRNKKPYILMQKNGNMKMVFFNKQTEKTIMKKLGLRAYIH